jgi:hypothetical protein
VSKPVDQCDQSLFEPLAHANRAPAGQNDSSIVAVVCLHCSTQPHSRKLQTFADGSLRQLISPSTTSGHARRPRITPPIRTVATDKKRAKSGANGQRGNLPRRRPWRCLRSVERSDALERRTPRPGRTALLVRARRIVGNQTERDQTQIQFRPAPSDPQQCRIGSRSARKRDVRPGTTSRNRTSRTRSDSQT